jgi:hypothetical protein
MFSVTFGKYTLLCLPDGLPELYSDYVARARLVEEIDLSKTDGKTCFVAVKEGLGWPFLVVAQRYSPAGSGFYPGVAFIPETDLLLIGAGLRLLAFRLAPPQRLWEDSADTGFWAWHRHGDYVLMAAELELAAWDTNGRKLWTTFVEPPWDFKVEGASVLLDVMGAKSSFPVATGPRALGGQK